MSGSEIGDSASYVVVPSRPGPIRPLSTGRDDPVDDLLDDMFGPDDPRGPSGGDAVLVGGGAAAAIAGVVAGWPPVVAVLGIGAVGLGAILPIRSLWRGVRDRRARSRVAAARGDGALLRVDDATTAGLAAAYDSVRANAAALDGASRVEVERVAHALLSEVVTLLDGGLPTQPRVAAYLEERTAALEALSAAATDRGATAGASSVVEARAEVDGIAGSSTLADAADIAARLRSR